MNLRTRPGALRSAFSAGLVAALLASTPVTLAAPRCPASTPSDHVLAVLPVDNRAGIAAPTREIRTALTERLEACGFEILADDTLEPFLARNRVRYTGGLSDDLALALRDELGVTASLVTTLDLFIDGEQPALAMTARIVTPESDGRVPWIDGFSRVGTEGPGILELSVVTDVRALVDRAADRLVRSLNRELTGSTLRRPDVADQRFRPRRLWSAERIGEVLTGGKRIAVLPFRNRTKRRHAGDIVALQVFRHFAARPSVKLVDPGEVRRGLLQMRLVAEEGVSRPQVEVLQVVLKADLLLIGAVFEYRDARGSQPPVVNFTTHLIDAADGTLLASTLSHNVGDDGVFFFDWGRSWTTHELTSKMGARVVQALFRSAPKSSRLTVPDDGRVP